MMSIMASTNQTEEEAIQFIEELVSVSDMVHRTGDFTPMEELNPFAEDAVHFPRGRATISGRSDIMDHFRESYDGEPGETDWEEISIKDVLISDDLAVYHLETVGTYSGENDDSETIVVDGIDVLERQADGSWKIRFSISSSDR